MFEINDKVKVKLHEPVGNPTTESANRYLSRFVNREGCILSRSTNPQKQNVYRVTFRLEAGKYVNMGIFYEYELEPL